MKKLFFIIGIFFLTAQAFSQKIEFDVLLKAITDPTVTEFKKYLKDNGFNFIKPGEQLFESDTWAFEYEPDTETAAIWVVIYLDPTSISIESYGHDMLYDLSENISEHCKYLGAYQNIDESENEIFEHESGVEFTIYYGIDDNNYVDDEDENPYDLPTLYLSTISARKKTNRL